MLLAQDVAEYTCTAINAHGVAQTQCEVKRNKKKPKKQKQKFFEKFKKFKKIENFQLMLRDKFEDWMKKTTKEKKDTVIQELVTAIKMPQKRQKDGGFYRSRTERMIDQWTSDISDMSDHVIF